jgi:chromosome segregation ATPase
VSSNCKREILAQRQQIGELMGQLRDTGHLVADGSLQRLTTKNTTLKRRVQHLTQEHASLQERLDGIRSNLRFAERRIADLEAQPLDERRDIPTARHRDCTT